jgi:hypothetical protein
MDALRLFWFFEPRMALLGLGLGTFLGAMYGLFVGVFVPPMGLLFGPLLGGGYGAIAEAPWLEGPVGSKYIGAEFYRGYVREAGLDAVTDDEDAGLLPSLDALAGERFDPSLVRPGIRDFYERTARYDLYVRIGWSGPFKHPPRTLIYLVGRNVGQFDMPLSAPAVAMNNELISLKDPTTDVTSYVGWLRRSAATGEAMLAGLCSPVSTLPAAYHGRAAGSSRASTRCREGRRPRSSARRIVLTAPSRSSHMAGASGKRDITGSTARTMVRSA